MYYHKLSKIVLPITERYLYFVEKMSTFPGSWHKATYLGNVLYLFAFVFQSTL